VGPLQFSTQGWRENALEKLQPGDLVVLVGTMAAYDLIRLPRLLAEVPP